MYNLPEFKFFEVKNKVIKLLANKRFWVALGLVIVACAMVVYVGLLTEKYFPAQTKLFLDYLKSVNGEQEVKEEPIDIGYKSDIAYEQAIINVVKNSSQSVVSILISKNQPVYKQKWVNPFGDDDSLFNIQIPQYVQEGTEYKEVGAGSGFIISADGLVLTNKHVVSDKTADYTILTSDGQKYSAKVLALDPAQDLALIRIDNKDNKIFLPLKLGDSSGIQLGQTVVAIGNALGQFSNTVSVGIISGLGRTISASDSTGSISETLEDIIQTDAAINSGNSGGPLLNLKGEVIGINTAIAQDAQSIAFAIPINYAKKDITQVMATNKITYPFLGIRYILVNEDVKEKYKLSVDYGAYVYIDSKNKSPAVTVGSPAEKAGIKSGDIVLEFNGEKITSSNSLSKIIQKYNAGDTVTLKLLRKDKEIELSATLSERVE